MRASPPAKPDEEHPSGPNDAAGTRFTSADSPVKASRFVRSSLPACFAVLACAAALISYSRGLHCYFIDDDWILINASARVPLSRWWEFFSPHVVWFYRPLQSLQLGLLYQLFGWNELPYNVVLLGLHFAVCMLAYTLLVQISRRPWFAACATAAFAIQWIYSREVLWKANFNTLQWAVITLAACAAFSRYLATKRRGWFYAANALCAFDFLARESAVTTPLLFILVWLVQSGGKEQLRQRAWRPIVSETARLFGPAVLFSVGYLIFHGLAVHNAYTPLAVPGYRPADPGQVLRQTLAILGSPFLFLTEHVVLGSNNLRFQVFTALLRDQYPVPLNLLILPALLVVLTWKKRDHLLAFGIAWLVAAFLPVILFADALAYRYCYLPALGMGIILVRVIEIGWTSVPRMPALRWTLRSALAAFVAYAVAANVAMTHFQIERRQSLSDRVLTAFEFLRGQRERVGKGPLILFGHPPGTLFRYGYGAEEMVQTALEDPTAEAIVQDTGVPPGRLEALKQIKRVYVLELGGDRVTLDPVSQWSVSVRSHP